jgi:hypothetical protein
MSLTLESAREVYGATFQDDQGRYFAKTFLGRKYGYETNMGALFVCFTCGHLCDCEGEE